MLASVLTVIQKSNKELQDKMEIYHKALENKVDASIKELKESNKAIESKIEASNRELKEINTKFQKDMENKLQSFQENVKRDIELETEGLIRGSTVKTKNQIRNFQKNYRVWYQKCC
jgi:23S rRNA pseudoU1915 N3-methylase RlmH